MNHAVVIDCLRTPIGHAHKDRGWFRHVRSDDLAVACVKALVERTGIDPSVIEDILMGNTQQTMEQGLNVARTIGLMAGLPVESGGATINRLCGSSLQAVNQADVTPGQNVTVFGAGCIGMMANQVSSMSVWRPVLT